jgi:hypothetical protein
MDELKQSRADVWWTSDRERLLLTALFPRRTSHILPIA